MIVAKFVDIANLLHSIKCGVQVDAIYMDILEIIRDTGEKVAQILAQEMIMISFIKISC